MRGRFSIEWMAQSSHMPPPGTPAAAGPLADPAACGTPPDSLPGFYSRQRAALEQQAAPAPPSGTEVGFSSSTEEETSGYESEGAERPASPPAQAAQPPSSPPAGRRPRTAFTAEQISSLERAFKRNAYLGTQDKAELCRKLSLSDKQIRNWFQNRRMKLKRSVQDALAQVCQASVASHFYPELQPFRPGPYARYPPPAATELLPYGSPLPLDSFYQYGGLQGAGLPAATPTLMGSYPSYPQYY